MEVPTPAKPRYDLDPEEMKAREGQLLAELAATSPDPDVYCVWISPDSPYADIARTHEAKHWDYIASIMTDKDPSSRFLFVVDTRDEATQGIKRVSRITFAVPDPKEAGATGMAIVDDVIDSGQGLDLDSFLDYYSEQGVDINRCFSVETNIKVKQAETYKGLPLADVGYLAMFNRIDELREGGLLYIFATVNQDSIDSFERIDLRAEPLAGRPELRTPDEKGGFDDDFHTVALPTTPHNLSIFEQITDFGAPEITIP
jgi:hypothetical protein